MDLVDNAEKEIENHRRKNHVKKFRKLIPLGECYFCGEEVEGEKLFCNGDHATFYSKSKMDE